MDFYHCFQVETMLASVLVGRVVIIAPAPELVPAQTRRVGLTVISHASMRKFELV